MNILKIENLVKKFGDFTALDGVDFGIEEGEVFGFIGPNGAGKTTTIRTVLGMYKATSGNISIFGKDAWKDSVEIHKQIAYVPGDVNLWNNLTGGEAIDFLLRLSGKINYKKKNELIEKYELDSSKKCRTYSKGNRQKVALVAAFASDAKLLILDEPTSGLDPLMEKIFQECVADVKREGKSVLLSSHILSEVESLCDNVGIIKKGKIIESGDLDKLRYLTRNNVKIITNKQIENLNKIEGVYNISQNGKNIDFQADSDAIGNIMKHVCQYDIEKLEVSPLPLEDLFMHYYNGNGGNR